MRLWRNPTRGLHSTKFRLISAELGRAKGGDRGWRPSPVDTLEAAEPTRRILPATNSIANHPMFRRIHKQLANLKIRVEPSWLLQGIVALVPQIEFICHCKRRCNFDVCRSPDWCITRSGGRGILQECHVAWISIQESTPKRLSEFMPHFPSSLVTLPHSGLGRLEEGSGLDAQGIVVLTMSGPQGVFDVLAWCRSPCTIAFLSICSIPWAKQGDMEARFATFPIKRMQSMCPHNRAFPTDTE